jgi:predicted ATPase
VAYRAWIERLAADRPVILAVDDLHWSDPSTRALAEYLLAPTDTGSVLFATAFRPDPTTQAWHMRTHVMQEYFHRAVEVPLAPLSPEASERLLDQLMPVSMLDPAARAEIVTRAEGNPLYLGELLRAVVEGDGVERGRTWTLPQASVGLLPPTLESLFTARIDRLPPGARRLAQAAAVIGRRFSVRVLERVTGGPDFQEDLSTLLRAEIVRERRRFPDLECSFRHGLLQEAALSTLTPARRRQLYGRIAAAFEEVFAASTEDHLETLALYYYRSDEPTRALGYLERAAQRALSLGAGQQAAELLKRGLKVAERAGDLHARKRIEQQLAEAGAPAVS